MFGRKASNGLKRHLEWFWPDIGLRTKMSVLVIAGTLSLIGLFVYLETVALQQSTERILQDRVVLAQATAGQIDDALAYVENVLLDAATRETWSDPDQVRLALAHTHERLQFYATHVV